MSATLAAWLALAVAPVHMLGPGTVSSAANEFGGAVTPDGRELYFSRSVPRSYMYAIYVSRKIKGHWRAPVVVPFSGQGRDFDPVLSPDGQTMLFISDRPVGGQPKRDYDIWAVSRRGIGWSAPRNLGAPINKAADDGSGNEWFASMASDGTIYFAADHPGDGLMRIYRSHLRSGRYEQPQELGPIINADAFDGEPIIAPDQSFLLFAAFDHAGGHGRNWDIYISRHLDGDGWSQPENLGSVVNSDTRDYSPRLECDGHHLIFTSERFEPAGSHRKLTYAGLRRLLVDPLNGDGNIYEVDLRDLNLTSLRSRGSLASGESLTQASAKPSISICVASEKWHP